MVEITTDDIVSKMEERGYVVYSYNRINDKLVSIQFMTSMNVSDDEPVINVTINVTPEKFGYFTTAYQVPNSINRLVSPECSLVMADKQFNRIAGKLIEQARVLKNVLGNEK